MISKNKEIPYGSGLHRALVKEIKARQQFSERKLSHRYQYWREADEAQQMYIKERDVDRIAKNSKRNSGVVDYVQVEVPYSFGMMMTQHTYFTSVFLSGRDPIHQFTARHGEPEGNLLAIEALMSYQVNTGRWLLPYYIWFYDACKYGVGIIGDYWCEERHNIASIQEEDELYLGQPTGKKKKVMKREEVVGYQGNKLFNIRPDKFFLDPRVTYAQLQKGEYCGVEADASWTDILQGESYGQYFNIDALKKNIEGRDRGMDHHTSPVVLYPETSDIIFSGDKRDYGYVKLWEFYVKVVPSDWDLGESKLPEIWVFTLANEKVLIECRPLGNYSNEFPFDAMEQEIDGYLLFKRGVMEQSKPLNDIVTWLFNSHFFNVRASLNNQFIYDPMAVTMKDVLDPSPGKRIRLRPEAAGRDLRTIFQQIPVQDITRSHLSDQEMVGELMQRSQGIVDNMMGMVNSGGRKTATEVRQAGSFGVNRQKTISEYMSAMGFTPHAQRMLQNTQQHYTLERKFKIAGDLPANAKFVEITPNDIAGFYDYVPVDGTLPIDRFAQLNLWKELFIALQGMPEMAGQFDLAGIFTWMAQLGGLKNINRFKLTVAPQGAVPGQASGGNVVPLRELRNLQEPGQIPGLGPTG